jgi:hypothetical protein
VLVELFYTVPQGEEKRKRGERGKKKEKEKRKKKKRSVACINRVYNSALS